MKARFGYIPFLHAMKKGQLRKIIDLANIKCPLPWASEVFGFYMNIPFEFSETSFS